MTQQLGCISLVVDDYERALTWFIEKLNFVVVEDTQLPGKRWLMIAPDADAGVRILLARAKNARETKAIGNQTGGRVAFFLYTNDFWQDYQHMLTNGVEFVGEPREEPYGTVVVFTDLYGNKWDFIQPHNS